MFCHYIFYLENIKFSICWNCFAKAQQRQQMYPLTCMLKNMEYWRIGFSNGDTSTVFTQNPDSLLPSLRALSFNMPARRRLLAMQVQGSNASAATLHLKKILRILGCKKEQSISVRMRPM